MAGPKKNKSGKGASAPVDTEKNGAEKNPSVVESINDKVTALCKDLDPLDEVVNKFVDAYEKGSMTGPEAASGWTSIKAAAKKVQSHFEE